MTQVNPADESEYFSDEVATFGDRVAAARRDAGLSQKDLCGNLGIKLKTLRSWEDDISEPRANKLQMLAGMLNVSLAWLLTGKGEGVSAPDYASSGNVVSVDPAAASGLLDELRAVRNDLGAVMQRLEALEQRMKDARRE